MCILFWTHWEMLITNNALTIFSHIEIEEKNENSKLYRLLTLTVHWNNSRFSSISTCPYFYYSCVVCLRKTTKCSQNESVSMIQSKCVTNTLRHLIYRTHSFSFDRAKSRSCVWCAHWIQHHNIELHDTRLIQFLCYDCWRWRILWWHVNVLVRCVRNVKMKMRHNA